MSLPRFCAPPPASRGPALVVRASTAVPPVQVPSGTRHVHNNNSTLRAAREKTVAGLPGVDTGVGRRCMSRQLHELPSLARQATKLPKRYTCRLHVGYAQVFLATSGA